jgi:hypothetical protein
VEAGLIAFPRNRITEYNHDLSCSDTRRAEQITFSPLPTKARLASSMICLCGLSVFYRELQGLHFTGSIVQLQHWLRAQREQR